MFHVSAPGLHHLQISKFLNPPPLMTSYSGKYPIISFRPPKIGIFETPLSPRNRDLEKFRTFFQGIRLLSGNIM